MQTDRLTVHLRRKPLADGRLSLYLDIYLGGRRSYEFLRLYLVPERAREDREANRQTLALAKAVQAKRLLQLLSGEYGLREERETGMDLLPFFDKVAGMREGRAQRWRNCRAHLARYTGGRDVRLRDIDAEWVRGFRRYLDGAESASHAGCSACQRKPLSLGTKGAYFGMLKTCLSAAAEKGYLPGNPAAGVKGFRAADPRRVYLTLDEVRRLDGTPCRYPALRRAFLFSCLTGLRKSDILDLTWGEVERNGEFVRLVYRQRKTGAQEYLDISPQAVAYMGERGEAGERVFKGFYFTSKMGAELRRWARDAGIPKPVTFHSGRHTFAVLMLDLGADIYTVQKLLGHKELRTTQIYADLLDKRKQSAVMLIPPISGEG